MANWLSPIPRLVQSESPFVIATLWAINGSSPDSVGARLIVTQQSCYGQLRSTHRQRTIVAQSRAILSDQHCDHLKQEYPLGDIAGVTNGFSTVVYEKFSQPYPDWLLSLEHTLERSDIVVLNNKITDRTHGITSAWEIAPAQPTSPSQANKPIITINRSGQSTTLSEAVKRPEFSVAVVGDSAVALALIEQLNLLPFSTQWLSEQDHPDSSILHCRQISDEAIDSLPENTQVAIATNTHERDILCCYRALLNTQLRYIGCLGSTKKSEVVKKQLKEMGISEARLKLLTMPIGLPGITGKQPAIIAASIVAQILSMHDDYFSA